MTLSLISIIQESHAFYLSPVLFPFHNHSYSQQEGVHLLLVFLKLLDFVPFLLDYLTPNVYQYFVRYIQKQAPM